MFGRTQELPCREMVELITEYLEGGLSRPKRRSFEAHLAGCEHCSEYLEQMRATIRLSGTLGVDDLTPEMRRDFAELFARWRDQDS